ncbi:PspC domain-containing protein [Knoellia sp. 3-2P3]|uniref:PspC domain-containing protein n=1 Tax=unclassified Knoellia TaxID=2618719 RepID=UPI0023DC4DA0|nr:PspC domain-containing protein [Knoellia sp. 3-2P3]MDF2093843.1 PspC domain-containing protein [Knoellia sp. 3-2P3]
MTQNPGQTAGTPQQSSGMDRFFGWLRELDLRRDTEDKWLAGVCSGIANRLGVDPLVIRAVLVVLILLGGLGVTLYLIAWAFVPNDKEEIVAERGLRHGDFWGIALLVLIALSLVGGSGFVDGNGWGLWWLWWVAIPVGVVIWLVTRNRGDDEARRQQVAQWGQQAGQWGQQAGAQAAAWGEGVGQKATARGRGEGGAPEAGQQPPGTAQQPPVAGQRSPGTAGAAQLPPGAPGAAQLPPGAVVPGGPGRYAPPPPQPPLPPRPPRPRHRTAGFLAAVVVSGLALATYGLTLWLHAEYAWSGDDHVVSLAAALTVVGVAVLGMGLAGFRSGLTGLLAVLLAITTWFASIVPGLQISGGVGDREWRPTEASSSQGYSLGIGSANLHLGDYPTDPATPGEIDASVGVGELRIYVPDDLTVEVRSDVNVGEVKEAGGWGLDENNQWSQEGPGGRTLSSTEVIGSGPTDLVVNAHVGAGEIIIGKE